jgi:hypothetical protein
MGALQGLAVDLDVEERTLRRAVSQGTLRAIRNGPRRLRLASGEREYLSTHWPLLLDRVLDEGRVLIDRDEQWRLLQERQSTIRVRARRAHRRQMAGAARAIEELTIR